MVIGNANNINLSASSFEKIIANDYLYVDKSKFIEHFLAKRSDVEIVARQRRIGKSLNLDMLNCFLTDKEDNRHLFEDLYIRTSPVWSYVNSSPVFLFDFKELNAILYKKEIWDKINRFMCHYLIGDDIDPEALNIYDSWKASSYDPKTGNRMYEDTTGFQALTEMVYKITGKRSYILIDEYDNPMNHASSLELYNEMRSYFTELFSKGFKGNKYLEKGFLTGVLRISHEDLLSGLNNPETFDVFADRAYGSDYGLSEEEATELCSIAGLDLDLIRKWYNGVRIGGYDIYNTFSVMSAVASRSISCFWGQSGTLDRIKSIISPEQKAKLIMGLGNGASFASSINSRINLRMLKLDCDDSTLYSLLVQSGYLRLESWDSKNDAGIVSIPNEELETVWRKFIFGDSLNNGNLNSFLRDLSDLENLSNNIVRFLVPLFDALSVHDLPEGEYKYKNGKTYRKIPEIYYHQILLTAFYAIKSDLGYRLLLSNRESGDGRYDILLDMGELVIIFELKSGRKSDRAETLAKNAIEQVKNKRYGADLGKPVIAVGCGFSQKRVMVKCTRTDLV
ncbi:MAG: ATP-binding protein [Clostridiales bacterium]|nr:ATP-binding protein [Clostridiales bacterium]